MLSPHGLRMDVGEGKAPSYGTGKQSCHRDRHKGDREPERSSI